ncbi:AzlD domain-containing protein [Oscillospiraceae bacterium OttesenSCG-928-G22]|nr:AzlD domain-containing protein [Oscillospiraceae bacterium OttesenSCG-928-G22]
MRLPVGEALVTVLIIAGVTFLIRLLPFLIFPPGKKTPAVVLYLGKYLPFSIIGMLIVYCIKDSLAPAWPFALPEAISILAVVVLHLWRKNSLLSIGGGTALYMVLVQAVFV